MPKPTRTTEPTPKPRRTPEATPSPTPTPESKPRPRQDYSGTSRFWFPALGINAAWRWYGCDYGGNPAGLGSGIYRWGCIPSSNTYLMSHAWSTFKALKRGYHSGALRTGLPVWFADRQGDVTEWKVKWIRHVTDEYLDATAGQWATNGSSSPIMTLQTCDGPNDEYRLIVRLVPAR